MISFKDWLQIYPLCGEVAAIYPMTDDETELICGLVAGHKGSHYDANEDEEWD